MAKTRTFLTSLICMLTATGLFGMDALPQEDASTPKEQASPKTKPARLAQPLAEKVAESPHLKPLAVAEPAKQVAKLLKIYPLKNLQANSAKKLLGVLPFGSDQIRIEANAETNSIVASGTKEQHSLIGSLLSEIDQLPIAKDASTKTKPDPDEPHFLPYARDARPAEIWLHKMLQTPVPKLDFPGATPLSHILEQIATYYTTTHGKSDNGTAFEFTILPDILELELESINSLEEVLIRDITLNGVTLENTLQIIFEQTDPRLTYEIRNEVMFITTMAKAYDSNLIRIYEVGHLTGLKFPQHVYPMNGLGGGLGMGGGGFGGSGGQFSVQLGDGGMMGGGGGAGMPPGKKKNTRKAKKAEEDMVYVQTETLQSLIMEIRSPPLQWADRDGEGGVIHPIGDTLAIRQTELGHRAIARLLNLLTESTSEIDQLLIAKDAHAGTKPNKVEPRFAPYARDAPPADIWLHKMLQTPVPLFDVPGETALSEVLEQIATYYTTTHGKSDGGKPVRFTILPDILEFELESINSLEDVLIQDIRLHGVTLENALQIIFERTDPRLTYEIRNEVMFITTMAKANDSYVTRVYDVEDLLAVEFERHINPTNGLNSGGMGLGGGSSGGGGGGFFSVQQGGQGAGGMYPGLVYGNNAQAQPANEPTSKKKKRKRNGSQKSEQRTFFIQVGDLIQTIQTITSPKIAWPDREGETGAINAMGNSLVIHQTRDGQREIVRFLNLLTEATRKSGE